MMESVKKLPSKRHIKPMAKRMFLRLIAGSIGGLFLGGDCVFFVVLLLAFFVFVAAIGNCKIFLSIYKAEWAKVILIILTIDRIHVAIIGKIHAIISCNFAPVCENIKMF